MFLPFRRYFKWVLKLIVSLNSIFLIDKQEEEDEKNINCLNCGGSCRAVIS